MLQRMKEKEQKFQNEEKKQKIKKRIWRRMIAVKDELLHETRDQDCPHSTFQQQWHRGQKKLIDWKKQQQRIRKKLEVLGVAVPLVVFAVVLEAEETTWCEAEAVLVLEDEKLEQPQR